MALFRSATDKRRLKSTAAKGRVGRAVNHRLYVELSYIARADDGLGECLGWAGLGWSGPMVNSH